MIEVKSLESAPLEILTDDEVEAMISEWDELEAKDQRIAHLEILTSEMNDDLETMSNELVAMVNELQAKDREIALLKTRLKEMAIKRDIYVGSFAPGYRRR